MDSHQLTAARVTMATTMLLLCLLPFVACSALEDANTFTPFSGEFNFQYFQKLTINVSCE
jgi:hypothetical protein